MEKYSTTKHKKKKTIRSTTKNEEKKETLNFSQKPSPDSDTFEKTVYIMMKNGNVPVNAKSISEISEKLKLPLNPNTAAGVLFSRKSQFFNKESPGCFSVKEKLFDFGDLFKKKEKENSEKKRKLEPQKKSEPKSKKTKFQSFPIKLNKKPTLDSDTFEKTIYVMMKNGNVPIQVKRIAELSEKLEIPLVPSTISANFTKKSEFFIKESPGFYLLNEKFFDFGDLFKKEENGEVSEEIEVKVDEESSESEEIEIVDKPKSKNESEEKEEKMELSDESKSPEIQPIEKKRKFEDWKDTTLIIGKIYFILLKNENKPMKREEIHKISSKYFKEEIRLHGIRDNIWLKRSDFEQIGKEIRLKKEFINQFYNQTENGNFVLKENKEKKEKKAKKAKKEKKEKKEKMEVEEITEISEDQKLSEEIEEDEEEIEDEEDEEVDTNVNIFFRYCLDLYQPNIDCLSYCAICKNDENDNQRPICCSFPECNRVVHSICDEKFVERDYICDKHFCNIENCENPVKIFCHTCQSSYCEEHYPKNFSREFKTDTHFHCPECFEMIKKIRKIGF
jgi:hypothetical protein